MEDREQIAAVDAGPTEAPVTEADVQPERYEMMLKDAVTGEVLGYGGGDTPEEAAERAIEDARVSHELDRPPGENRAGVRD